MKALLEPLDSRKILIQQSAIVRETGDKYPRSHLEGQWRTRQSVVGLGCSVGSYYCPTQDKLSTGDSTRTLAR